MKYEYLAHPNTVLGGEGGALNGHVVFDCRLFIFSTAGALIVITKGYHPSITHSTFCSEAS